MRSSVQAQLLMERAPLFSQRCLVNQRPAPKILCGPFLFQLSCEGSLVDLHSARVARAQGMTRLPLHPLREIEKAR